MLLDWKDELWKEELWCDELWWEDEKDDLYSDE